MSINPLKSEAALRAASGLLGAYLRFALNTTRWTVHGEANLAAFAAESPGIVAFWHEALPMMPALCRHVRRTHPSRRIAVLISRNRDGRLISNIVRHLRVDLIHGSSAKPGKTAKGGAAGLRSLLAALAENAAVVITPDGPRGPRRMAAPGAAQLAALSGAPILPTFAATSRHIVLRSWDRMAVPLPFGRGALVCLPPLRAARDDIAGVTQRLTAALTEAAAQAHSLCRR